MTIYRRLMGLWAYIRWAFIYLTCPSVDGAEFFEYPHSKEKG
jgi:hypothetical protein